MSSDDRSPQRSTLGAWQHTLLPLMGGLLVSLAAFFFLATLYLMLDLKAHVTDPPALSKRELVGLLELGNAAPVEKALVLLEANALERRYHQANISLMARLWTRYLGFLTGMILAFVGAGFVLGKMREQRADLAAEGAFGKLSLSTHSPGLLMVGMGTILMLTTILNHPRIDVADAPVYLATAHSRPAPTAYLPKPEPLDEDSPASDEPRTATDPIEDPVLDSLTEELDKLVPPTR